ncbi:MAG: AMP-binding protein [Gammaproteobacteria bacterium]|nr:AMP-binding protein [Gammaproteobacteria bacterium]MBU1416420.1 AMP-binding protein [Gammaproteobacteria bacterium]
MSELTVLSRPDFRPTAGRRFLSAGRDDAPAIVTDDGRTVSHGQLRDEALLLGKRFGNEKKLILIVARNEPETISAYVAALNSGHAVILLGPEPTALIEHVCAQFNPNFICHRDGSEWHIIERHADELPLHPELACLLSTSGTTGEGKFVRLSYRNLIANALSIAEYLGIAASDRFLLNLPINYSFGLSILNSHLIMGARLLVSERSVTEPELWEFFRSNEGTGLAGVPHTYKLLDASGFEDIDLPSLRTLTQAGGRLPEPLARKFARWSEERGARFFIMYGQTEASPRISYLPPELATTHPDCIGRAIPGGTLELIDGKGNVITAIDTEGELQYRGPNVMMGYATHVAELALGPGPEVLRTGDLAVMNRTGLFRVTGREKRFLKIYGLRISLDEIERKLEAQSIKALCGGNDEFLGVMTTEDQAEEQYLKELISRISGLPITSILLLRVADFPVLPTGKIDYRSVGRELLGARDAQAKLPIADGFGATAPDDASPMSRIVSTFRETFPGRPIGPRDSFVSLGGDSLNYVSVAMSLEDVIAALPAHWEKLTLAELEALASASRKPAREARKVRAVESSILIRAVATILVVVNHAGLGMGMFEGGAALLLAVVGFNFSRFQRVQFADGRGVDVMRNFFENVLVPYWLVIFGFGVMVGDLRLADVLLFDSFFMRPPNIPIPFGTWFIQVMTQIMLLMYLLFLSKRARQAAASRPYYFGLALLLVTIGIRLFETVAYRKLGTNLGGGLTIEAWLFALGFAIAAAETRKQKALLSLLAVVLPWVFHANEIPRSTIVMVGCLLVIWVPRVILPNRIAMLVGVIASASMFIYMLHQVLHPNPLSSYWQVDYVEIFGGICLGIAGWWLFRRVQERLKKQFGRMGRPRSSASLSTEF